MSLLKGKPACCTAACTVQCSWGTQWRSGVSLPQGCPTKIVPFFRLESGLSLQGWAQRESCCFGADFLRGGMGCLALARSVQQASRCCLYLRKWGKRLLQGSGVWLCPPAQPSAPCGVRGARAGVRSKPLVQAQSCCASREVQRVRPCSALVGHGCPG